MDDFRFSLCDLHFQHQFKLEVGKGILKREVNDFHNPETSVFRIQNITESKNLHPANALKKQSNLCLMGVVLKALQVHKLFCSFKSTAS
ncbi:hypothetical protein ANAPRD1_00318 [Anaplasma phagocytophilum]|nr:hypothetical protein ANAPRD1_00318 [Anaplasma phagocytophilum]SCV64712.1 hypothetical protein ANAPH2_01042 [Anaplasma phagocytophilum]